MDVLQYQLIRLESRQMGHLALAQGATSVEVKDVRLLHGGITNCHVQRMSKIVNGT